MIDGIMTVVAYGLAGTLLLGLLTFAIADVSISERARHVVLFAIVVLVGAFGIILLADLIGVSDLGIPRVRL